MSKGVLYFLVLFVIVIIAIPSALVTILSNSSTESVSAEDHYAESDKEDMPTVAVYLTKEQRVVEYPLEAYVKGVVAAEMPANFHIEALKAQALCARTYIMERMKKKDFKDMSRWGVLAKKAIVTDSIGHQVYLTDEDLRSKWGDVYSQKMNHIQEAVNATKGQIITYQGNPIYAAFFSTSNGRTENSEDYFNEKYPYLRSVTSYWDKQSPEYVKEKVFSIPQMIRKVEAQTGKNVALTTATGGPLLRVLKRTEGNRIARIQIGDKIFSGRTIRTALNLSSSDFTIQTTKKTITFVSRGYGHGVGMSQWGANLMAQSGKTAQDIIFHYYQGVQIDQVK